MRLPVIPAKADIRSFEALSLLEALDPGSHRDDDERRRDEVNRCQVALSKKPKGTRAKAEGAQPQQVYCKPPATQDTGPSRAMVETPERPRAKASGGAAVASLLQAPGNAGYGALWCDG